MRSPQLHPDALKAEPVSPGYALRLDDVSFSYGSGDERTDVLERIDLAVAVNETVALLGPSGCGKSTLLSIAAGLLTPRSGSVSRDGEVALMPQRDLLLPWRSAIANAALALEAEGMSRRRARAAAEPLFERFGLTDFEDASPDELSGGMRQRVAFLRTVLTGRPTLALDEPFASLDSLSRADLQAWLIDALAQAPRTVLLVTHDVDEALVMSDRVTVMSSRPGRLRQVIETRRPIGIERDQWVTSTQFNETKRELLAVLHG